MLKLKFISKWNWNAKQLIAVISISKQTYSRLSRCPVDSEAGNWEDAYWVLLPSTSVLYVGVVAFPNLNPDTCVTYGLGHPEMPQPLAESTASGPKKRRCSKSWPRNDYRTVKIGVSVKPSSSCWSKTTHFFNQKDMSSAKPRSPSQSKAILPMFLLRKRRNSWWTWY